MMENIYKHLIQLSISFPLGAERLFDLLSDGRAKLEFVFNENRCELTLTVGERVEKVFEDMTIDAVLASDKREIICAARAFWRAGGKICGFYPEWGIIDGVKPVRLYLNLLSGGADAAKIIGENYLLSPEKAQLVSEVGDFEYEIAKKLPSDSYNLYVSIPFCPTRCKYCSFISADAAMSRLIPNYLDALCEEVKNTAEIMRDMTLNTVYIGGGTPTVFTAQQLKILLSEIKSSFGYNNIEYTLEAGRPDTLNAEKLAVAREYGVNRMSVNTQTTNNDVLAAVGRRHTAEDYFAAFEMARKAGIPVINTDLIAGFEGDTFRKSLDDVIALSPENLTVHTLCVKNAAGFREDGFVRKNENIASMLEYARSKCHINSYFPYYLYKQKNALDGLENVGYAKKGTECVYNVCMMSELNSTVALGAGAATKMVYPHRISDRTVGFFDCKYPKEYIECAEKTRRKYEFLRNFVDEVKGRRDGDRKGQNHV